MNSKSIAWKSAKSLKCRLHFIGNWKYAKWTEPTQGASEVTRCALVHVRPSSQMRNLSSSTYFSLVLTIQRSSKAQSGPGIGRVYLNLYPVTQFVRSWLTQISWQCQWLTLPRTYLICNESTQRFWARQPLLYEIVIHHENISHCLHENF